jgi:hypothetical protein
MLRLPQGGNLNSHQGETNEPLNHFTHSVSVTRPLFRPLESSRTQSANPVALDPSVVVTRTDSELISEFLAVTVNHILRTLLVIVFPGDETIPYSPPVLQRGGSPRTGL